MHVSSRAWARVLGCRRFRRPGVSALLAPLVAGAAVAGGAATGHGTRPSSTPEIRAEAIAEPSVVLIATRWKGYVHVPPNTVTVKSEWVGPVTAYTLCSGFAANPSGFIVTAGHCVDNRSILSGGKHALIERTVDTAISNGVVTRSEARILLSDIEINGAVEGLASGSPPAQKIEVFQPSTVVSHSLDNGLTAAVVDFRGVSNGDVGLLKVQAPAPLASMQIAAQTPDLGTSVISAGYPASVAEVTDTKVRR